MDIAKYHVKNIVLGYIPSSQCYHLSAIWKHLSVRIGRAKV